MNKILGFQGEYRWLSNFWPCYIIYQGMEYPSVEHAYCAAKCDEEEDRVRFQNPTDVTASQAKRRCREMKIRSDWDSIKLEIMRDLIKQKFSLRNKKLMNDLIATDDAYIEETNYWNDTFCGVCKGVGENNLGKIIMARRAELNGNI